MYTVALKRSFGDAGSEYQSVMMTPPKGSAEASGMKFSVSSEARHRYELTPMPASSPPPPPPPKPNTEAPPRSRSASARDWPSGLSSARNMEQAESAAG